MKVLIGVMIIGTIGFIILIAGGVYFIGGAMKQMQDPAQVKANAESIAKFSEPLPTGWKFTMALNMLGTSIAVLTNEKENMNITLLKLPRSDKDMDSNAVIESYAEKGVPSMSGNDPQKTSAKVDIKDRGKLAVGGEEMAYALGSSERGDEKFSQMIGCIMPKGTKQAIIVQGVTLASEEYKFEQTKALLNSIKGF
ncbi:MAG: hypothetical protein IT343_13415 [Candidatus Melainabacteria bacterium]|nr:hypothetical protein [Candidatus Melainabacteria bacterium]